MKKKLLKIGAFCLAAAMIVGLAIFANGLIGNPISYLLARSTAKKHLQNNYAETDYELDSVSYSFKTGGYYAYVVSPSSEDSSFTLGISSTGKLDYSDYEYRVEGRGNTASRLYAQYRDAVQGVLHSSFYPYTLSMGYGRLEFEQEEGETLPDGFWRKTDLELDRVYNINEIAKTNGRLVLYVDSDEVSEGKAAEILLTTKRLFDEVGVKFYSVYFVLDYAAEEGALRPEGSIRCRDFLYTDIYEEGLAERIREAAKATEQEGSKEK